MSGRTIPIALADHLAGAATTTCRFWKVMAFDAPPFGLTSLDRDVTYDDGSGDGPILYKAKRGYTPYTIEATADLSVDNSEMEVLIAEFEVDGFTAEAIRRGVYDDAEFIEYMINYLDPSQGHVIMSSGTVGQIRQVDNLVCFPESRSLTQTLKQKAIIEKGSNNCRVKDFGDERCKYPVEDEWTPADVDSVGVETDRVFTISGVAVEMVNDYYRPGLFLFLTGANAGRSYEIESYTSGGVVTLAIPTEEPITTADSGEIRRDCTRLWSGHNSCEEYNNRPNFRGEPFRPVADTAGLMVPGAGSSGTDIQVS